ncbi:MAG: hypothetical protein IJU56_04150 [Clostridia bacterium]|nr:hypothetical protein [Clostridia bacterium]
MKKVNKILSLILVFVLLATVCFSVSAKRVTNQSRPNTLTVVTTGDKVFWRTTTITIKNVGPESIYVTNAGVRNCSVQKRYGTGYGTLTTATVYTGGSIDIRIKTWLGNAGNVKLKISSACGDVRFSYDVKCSDNSLIVRS